MLFLERNVRAFTSASVFSSILRFWSSCGAVATQDVELQFQPRFASDQFMPRGGMLSDFVSFAGVGVRLWSFRCACRILCAWGGPWWCDCEGIVV